MSRQLVSCLLVALVLAVDADARPTLERVALERVALGHGVVYVHPRGASSRVSCSSPRAATWVSVDQTERWAGPEWHVNVCFDGGHVPLEALISQHGAEVECVWEVRVVTRLADCT